MLLSAIFILSVFLLPYRSLCSVLPLKSKMSDSLLRLVSSETDGAVIPLAGTLKVLEYLSGKLPTPTR